MLDHPSSDSFAPAHTMEVFMREVPFSIDDLELKQELSLRLHSPLFGDAPYNFVVRLFQARGRGNRRHLGKGTLVVPSFAIGYQFLELVKAEPVVVHNRCISFEEGKKQVKQSDLDLLEQPYAQYKPNEAVPSVNLATLQFGWPCHDDTISVEWESPSDYGWTLELDSENRRFVFKSQKGVEILVTLKNIQSVTFDSLACVIHLERPPFFQEQKQAAQNSHKETTPEVFGFGENLWDDFGWGDILKDLQFGLEYVPDDSGPTHNRLVGLDGGRSNIFAFLLVIRITFTDYPSLNEFKSRARKARLTTYFAGHEVSKQGLFDPNILERFNYWLKGLPFEVGFQLHGLVSRRYFNPKELLAIRPAISAAIEDIGHLATAECIRLLEQQREESRREQSQTDEPPEQETGESSNLSTSSLFKSMLLNATENSTRKTFREYNATGNIFHCYRVMVTLTSLVLTGPLPDETNRVLRKYMKHQSNFIRVEFREENRLRLHPRLNGDIDSSKFIDERFGGVLNSGLIIAGRKFDFLAYSSSALKEHAVWFVKPFRGTEGLVNAESIRSGLGDFSKVIHFPALYGARIAQAFSATEASITVEAEQMLTIDDKESVTHSLFTDGVGTMSPGIVDDIWAKGGLKRGRRHTQKPSSFQIRMGGFKGMLCVDDRLEGKVICTRPSMNKFTAPDRTVEIARAFDRPMAMYLNRPLIMLLETLGIPIEPFMELQRDAVKQTEAASKSMDLAADWLRMNGLGVAFNMPSIMLNLFKINVSLESQARKGGLVEFLARVQKFAVNHVLRDIKYKSRIHVPDAWTLVGVADEYDYLEEGEIYAYVCNIDGYKEYIEGPVMISRSPTVHPGDARMVWAIGKPPTRAPAGLGKLTNCVVFSCKGQRSLPFMLAGGDLDGDIYCLVKDPRLHPRIEFEPANYDGPERVRIDAPSTAIELAQFVVDFIKNDLLGVIATQILLTADLSKECMADPDCLILAALHSDAVDYPKTGRPVNFTQLPKPRGKEKPDWYAKETDEGDSTYESKRILGHLFRAIELPATAEVKRIAKKQRRQLEKGTEDVELKAVLDSYAQSDGVISGALKKRADPYIDTSVHASGGAVGEITEMLAIADKYTDELGHICSNYSLSNSIPLTEEEVVAGTIVASPSAESEV